MPPLKWGRSAKSCPTMLKEAREDGFPIPSQSVIDKLRIPMYCRFCAKARTRSERFPFPGWGTHAYQKCYYNLDSEQSKGSKEEPAKEVPVKASPAKRPKYQEESSVTAVDVSEEEKNKPKKKEESPERKEKEEKPEKKKDDKEKKDDRKEKRPKKEKKRSSSKPKKGKKEKKEKKEKKGERAESSHRDRVDERDL